jgi:hypothetical protein
MTAVMLGTGLLAPLASTVPAEAAGQSCAELADVALGHDSVRRANASIVPASGETPAFCRVELVEPEAVTIVVGLPLSDSDGGDGGAVSGAWSGNVINEGGGGYVGLTNDPVLAVARGAVGSNTDAGHSLAWCATLDPRTGLPNSNPAECAPIVGGGFVLDGNEELVSARVRDFIKRGIRLQVDWALRLTKAYYGRPARRNYWYGASTGGRQGWEMAQSFGRRFDGIFAGAPAMNWNRFIAGEAWPAVVVNELLGRTGMAPAKFDHATSGAVAACDSKDQVRDGVIAEPWRCNFDARRLICDGVPPSVLTCLTPKEARAINLIWDGPRDSKGRRLWGGLPRGADVDAPLGVLMPGGVEMSPMIETYVSNWVYEDPDFDWREITITEFPRFFRRSFEKFRTTAATDVAQLREIMDADTKVISYHGLSDPLITPYGTHNYAQRLLDRYGWRALRHNVRFFWFPAVEHALPELAGPDDTANEMLDLLEAWVETGRAPQRLVQTHGDGIPNRVVCAFPDRAVVTGTANGHPTYKCQHRSQSSRAFRQYVATVSQDWMS